jgi:3-methyladenine DNA glycosylase AlkD
MLSQAANVKKELRRLADKKKAQVLRGFFKTGPGEYGEGDIFLGVTAPQIRRILQEQNELSLGQTQVLLRSPIHEERAFALLSLVGLCQRSDDKKLKEKVYKLYFRNTKYINNWDLVDLSAPQIVGAYLADKSKTPLAALALSKSLWERRIAILATFHFIKNYEFSMTLQIAAILLRDKEDLMHKAVGWMLREVGKRNLAEEERFLKKHCRKMPRTMLRYAIERFPEDKRQAYLRGRPLIR